MSCPLLIFSQSDYLIQVVDTNSHFQCQIVQIQISWLLQKPTDLDLHCLQRHGISGFSWTRVKWTGYIFRGGNSIKTAFLGRQSCLCCFSGEVILSNLLLSPMGANSFLLELTHFKKGLGLHESEQEVTKVVSLVNKWQEKTSKRFRPLKSSKLSDYP